MNLVVVGLGHGGRGAVDRRSGFVVMEVCMVGLMLWVEFGLEGCSGGLKGGAYRRR